MKKIVRLTEEELKRLMHNSVQRALMRESVNMEREIILAQKTLCKFPLSEVGLRLEGTQFYRQFKRMRDELVSLNSSLIDYIKKEKK